MDEEMTNLRKLGCWTVIPSHGPLFLQTLL
jgi:hypothetical protein